MTPFSLISFIHIGVMRMGYSPTTSLMASGSTSKCLAKSSGLVMLAASVSRQVPIFVSASSLWFMVPF